MPDPFSKACDTQAATSPARGFNTADGLCYISGILTQTLLWFLLFLAIFTAATGGDQVTEFRYVGF